MKRLTNVVASLGMLLTASSAMAGTIVRCESRGMGQVIILLDSEERFGKRLSCISASFIYDLTPCAPKGGYGLSSPRGQNELVGVVEDPVKASRHSGGVTSFFADPITLTFMGGRDPFDQWMFTADRHTGFGSYVRQGRAIDFRCHRARDLERGVNPQALYDYDDEPVVDK